MIGVVFNACLLDFYTTQILTSTAVSIEYIGWLIEVTNNNDARWKPEINSRIWARMGEGRGVNRVLVGKPEGKRPLGRP
jgi:hypothetical protein